MDKLNVIEVVFNSRRVGRIALTDNGLCAFEYDVEFLRTGFSISPYYLPLRYGLFIARKEFSGGIFGVFQDSLPDCVGNFIDACYLHEENFDSGSMDLLQRLAFAGKNGIGALEYYPDKGPSTEHSPPDFHQLAIMAAANKGVMRNHGGYNSQANSNVLVNIGGRDWLVKFRTTGESEDAGKKEYEYSILARKCGINTPETKLFEGKYFGVERFDRQPKEKIHTISIAGLLQMNGRQIPDYSVLLKICLDLTRNVEEVYSLFRLMIFNIAISNRGNEAKKISFQYKNNNWILSPAYDFLPSFGYRGFDVATVNGRGDPSLRDVQVVAKESGLQKKRVDEIVEQVVETCRSNNKLNYPFI